MMMMDVLFLYYGWRVGFKMLNSSSLCLLLLLLLFNSPLLLFILSLDLLELLLLSRELCFDQPFYFSIFRDGSRACKLIEVEILSNIDFLWRNHA